MADREYAHVRAELDGDDTGLRADDVRDLVVEVRKAVPAEVRRSVPPANLLGRLSPRSFFQKAPKSSRSSHRSLFVIWQRS